VPSWPRSRPIPSHATRVTSPPPKLPAPFVHSRSQPPPERTHHKLLEGATKWIDAGYRVVNGKTYPLTMSEEDIREFEYPESESAMMEVGSIWSATHVPLAHARPVLKLLKRARQLLKNKFSSRQVRSHYRTHMRHLQRARQTETLAPLAEGCNDRRLAYATMGRVRRRAPRRI
jgi:hypothetical protein